MGVSMTMQIYNFDESPKSVREFVLEEFQPVGDDCWDSRDDVFSNWEGLEQAVAEGLVVSGRHGPDDSFPFREFAGCDGRLLFQRIDAEGTPLVRATRGGDIDPEDAQELEAFREIQDSIYGFKLLMRDVPDFWCGFEHGSTRPLTPEERSDREWIRVVEVQRGFETMNIGVCGDESSPADSDIEESAFEFLSEYHPEALSEEEKDEMHLDSVRIRVLRDDGQSRSLHV